jgi:hypothetical protein
MKSLKVTFTTAEAVRLMIYERETFACVYANGQPVDDPQAMYFTTAEGFCVDDAPKNYFAERYRKEMHPDSKWERVDYKESNLRSFIKPMIENGMKVTKDGWYPTGYIKYKDGWFVDESGDNVPLDFFDDDDLMSSGWQKWSYDKAHAADTKEPTLEETIHAICDLLLAAAVKSIEDRGTIITKKENIQ